MSDPSAEGDTEPAARHWLEPNTVIALAALAVSALAVVVGPVLSTWLDRGEAIREERRTEYARFIEAVERCGTNAENVIGQSANHTMEAMEPVIDAVLAGQPLSPAEELQIARFGMTLRADALAEQATCRADLGRGAATISLLAGDQEVASKAYTVMTAVLSYRSAARDVAVTLFDAVTDVAPPTSAGTTATSTPTTTVPEAPTALCGEVLEGAALIDVCLDQFNSAYTDFRQSAHDDVQPPGPWWVDLFWFWYLPWIALVVIGVFAVRRWLRRSVPAGPTVADPEPSGGGPEDGL